MPSPPRFTSGYPPSDSADRIPAGLLHIERPLVTEHENGTARCSLVNIQTSRLPLTPTVDRQVFAAGSSGILTGSSSRQQYPVAAGAADRLSPSARSCDLGLPLLFSGSVDRNVAPGHCHSQQPMPRRVGDGRGTEADTWYGGVWSLGGLLSELFDLRSHRYGDTFRVVSPTTSYHFPPLPTMTHSHPAIELDQTDLVRVPYSPSGPNDPTRKVNQSGRTLRYGD